MGGFGYVAMGIAVVFFGSNFVPVKKFNAGDGFVFQWIMCAAIWIVGLVVQCIRDAPKFWPFAMLGGVIWATGNITVVPIVNLLGLGLGLLTWGLSNMLTGWATSKFGWFGIEKNTFTHQGQILNYCGIVVAVLSMIPYVLIKPNEEVQDDTEAVPLVSALPDLAGKEKDVPSGPIEAAMARASPRNRRTFGFVLALLAGLCYGSNFDPPMIIMAKINKGEPGYTGSTQGIDFVFSHFCGIFLASTIYTALYCAYRQNRPFVNNQLLLPGLASGFMWAIAQVMFFIANSELGASIVFPVLGTGPGVVGALWSVFVFGEITGRRNYILLGIAILLTFIGVGLITASKM